MKGGGGDVPLYVEGGGLEAPGHGNERKAT